MQFQTVPLIVIGGTNQNRSVQANNALTKNWYPEITIPGRNKAVLLPWPGNKTFGTSPKTTDRGLHVFLDTLYQVSGDTLYSIDSSGTYTAIGAIAGNGRCIFSNSTVGVLNEMVITTDTYVYVYDGTTLSYQSSIQASAATYLNSKTVYDAGSNVFKVTGASGATDIQSSGVAESSSDLLLRPYAFGQFVYMCGSETIEPFYDDGVSDPPFVRMSGGIMQKGVQSIHSIANTDQFLYLLGDDFNVYQISQTSYTPVSPPAIVSQISQLDTANATAFTITLDGQDFYVLNFGVNELTYVYSEQTREWFNLSSGVKNGRFRASSYVYVYGKHIAADYSTGNTFEIDFDTYSDLGNTFQRSRQLPQFNSSLMGTPGKRLLMDKAKFILQTGVGLASGQGLEPKIMVQYSKDGGATWSTERWLKMGRMGQYFIKSELWEMVSFYDITFKLTVSDPVFSSLHDASIDIQEDGY